MRRLFFLFLLGVSPLLAEAPTPLEVQIESLADSFHKWGFARDVHGFFDLSFKTKYVTPRGLLVSNQGLATQCFTGLIFDVCKQVSLVIGAWNNLSSQQDSPSVGSWNELDWFVGLNVTFCHNWKLNIQYIEFLSPPGYFNAENNATATLIYEDHLFNPYAKFFYAISGDSTVIVGKPGGTYYAEFGLMPTLELNLCCQPIILTMPTWVSVGPAEFWNGGIFGLKSETSHLGVFSTGITGEFPLQFISHNLGSWSFNLGVQYYYLINDNLLEAQIFQLQGLLPHVPQRNLVVATTGFTLYY